MPVFDILLWLAWLLPFATFAIATKSTPIDQWIGLEKTISLTAQVADTAWQNLGTNTTWEVRAKLKITTAGAGTTYQLEFADDASGTNIVAGDLSATLATIGTYYLVGMCDVAKQFVRINMTGGAPTFDVDFFAKQVS